MRPGPGGKNARGAFVPSRRPYPGPPGHGGTAGAASHRVDESREDYNSQVRPAPPRMRDATSPPPTHSRAILAAASSISSLAEGSGLGTTTPGVLRGARAWALCPAAILARGNAAAAAAAATAATKQTRERRHRGTGGGGCVGKGGALPPRSLSMCQARPGRWVPFSRQRSPPRLPALARGALPSGRGAVPLPRTAGTRRPPHGPGPSGSAPVTA